MGLPGLVLLIVVLVIVPLAELPGRPIAAAMAGRWRWRCLRIWLFGLYLSSMESFFLDRADPTWITFLLAVFGLHYLARFRVEA